MSSHFPPAASHQHEPPSPPTPPTLKRAKKGVESTSTSTDTQAQASVSTHNQRSGQRKRTDSQTSPTRTSMLMAVVHNASPLGRGAGAATAPAGHFVAGTAGSPTQTSWATRRPKSLFASDNDVLPPFPLADVITGPPLSRRPNARQEQQEKHKPPSARAGTSSSSMTASAPCARVQAPSIPHETQLQFIPDTSWTDADRKLARAVKARTGTHGKMESQGTPIYLPNDIIKSHRRPDPLLYGPAPGHLQAISGLQPAPLHTQRHVYPTSSQGHHPHVTGLYTAGSAPPRHPQPGDAPQRIPQVVSRTKPSLRLKHPEMEQQRRRETQTQTSDTLSSACVQPVQDAAHREPDTLRNEPDMRHDADDDNVMQESEREFLRRAEGKWRVHDDEERTDSHRASTPYPYTDAILLVRRKEKEYHHNPQIKAPKPRYPSLNLHID